MVKINAAPPIESVLKEAEWRIKEIIQGESENDLKD